MSQYYVRTTLQRGYLQDGKIRREYLLREVNNFTSIIFKDVKLLFFNNSTINGKKEY